VGEVTAEKTGSSGDDYVTQDIEAWARFLRARDGRPVAGESAIPRVHELSEGLPLSQPEATAGEHIGGRGLLPAVSAAGSSARSMGYIGLL
jgi:hypothetical protein